MTLNELISKLSELRDSDPRIGEMTIKFESLSRDYWRTNLALSIDKIKFATVRYADYHQADKIVEKFDSINDTPEVGAEENVVVLIY